MMSTLKNYKKREKFFLHKHFVSFIRKLRHFIRNDPTYFATSTLPKATSLDTFVPIWSRFGWHRARYNASAISSFPKSQRRNAATMACVFYEEFAGVPKHMPENGRETTSREFHHLDNVCTLNNASDNFPDIETSGRRSGAKRKLDSRFDYFCRLHARVREHLFAATATDRNAVGDSVELYI